MSYILSGQEFYKMKSRYRGFYMKFNTEVISKNLNKIFDYNEMFHNARNFLSFESFYENYTKGKEDWIYENAVRMFSENKDKYNKLTVQMVLDCILIRMGNCYIGTYMEDRILNELQLLSDWIKIEKTDDYIDTKLKVDAIVTLEGISSFGLQIKPITKKNYDIGDEAECHKRFKLETDMDVHYLYYIDHDKIVFDDVEMYLNNRDRLVEIVEKIGLQY